MMQGKFARVGALVFVTAAMALAARPAGVAAQEIFLPGDLTEAPKLVSMSKAAQLIQESYPASLRHNRVGGTVKLQFVVGPDGHVEPATIRVVASTEPSLGDAAISVAQQLEFSPPKVNQQAVRTQVLLPLTYKP